jgi:RNA polymerase sigma factor (sigma-70 family)
MRPDELPRIAHDPAAFEAFYRDHVEAIMRFVTRRVDDPHLAADLTAEVFLAAIDGAATYRPAGGAPGAWLFGIARNVVSSEWRRAARERRAHAEIQGRRLLDDDDVARIQERIDAQAQARDLHAAIGGLPEGERAVFELIALDGLSTPEAAAVLGIRKVTARVRLHRARTALRRRLFDDDSATITRLMEA